MHIRLLLICFGAAFLLAGCSATDRAAWGWDDPDADDAKCRSYGAKPGTQAYIQCRMQAEQYRLEVQKKNLAASAQLGAMGTNLMILGAPR